MSPTGPCFEEGPRGYFTFVQSISSQLNGNLLGAMSGLDKTIVYDAAGLKWHSKGCEPRYKRSWWLVLVANLGYNPTVRLTVLWREPKPYELGELKRAYSKAVNLDDDDLTQFVEAKELKRRISEARSFAELVEVYKWMETDHTDEETA